MNTKVKGYILGAIAAATYGMNPLFTLPLYKEGMNRILFFSSDICLPFPSWGLCSKREVKFQSKAERNIAVSHTGMVGRHFFSYPVSKL